MANAVASTSVAMATGELPPSAAFSNAATANPSTQTIRTVPAQCIGLLTHSPSQALSSRPTLPPVCPALGQDVQLVPGGGLLPVLQVFAEAERA